jgi:hypothetical protein
MLGEAKKQENIEVSIAVVWFLVRNFEKAIKSKQ